MANLTSIKPYERESQPWSLPKDVTKTVCLLAGREASAALCIALAMGRHTGSTAAHEATFYEPFNYWDWHGVAPDDDFAREVKRQRFWEHERGFIVNDTKAFGYPTSRARWQAFKSELEKSPESSQWVKRIAIAHWMSTQDLTWCVCLAVASKDMWTDARLSGLPSISSRSRGST
jgi:hypothetical protein